MRHDAALIGCYSKVVSKLYRGFNAASVVEETLETDASHLLKNGKREWMIKALRETEWSIETIERAVSKGWVVRIHYVQRPLDLGIEGAIKRADNSGRWGLLEDLPGIYHAAQTSIINIAKHFKDNPAVYVNIWLNDGKTIAEKPKLLTLSQIDIGGKYSYDTRDEEGLDRTRERRGSAGVSERFWREGAEIVRRKFSEAVASGKHEPRVLRLLAGNNAELRGLIDSVELSKQTGNPYAHDSLLARSAHELITPDLNSSAPADLNSANELSFYDDLFKQVSRLANQNPVLGKVTEAPSPSEIVKTPPDQLRKKYPQAKLVPISQLKLPNERLVADDNKLLRHGRFSWVRFQPIVTDKDYRITNGVTRYSNALQAGVTHVLIEIID